MSRKGFVIVALAVAVAGLMGTARPVGAADWPTYRHDARRSGVTVEPLPARPERQWVFTPPFPPKRAWGDPHREPVEHVLELPRMRFDDVFHVVAAGGMVYFGSSGDNKVYALDARSGQVRWTFDTEGPVRLAATVWAGRVYVGSDDGRVYCLDGRDGKLIWRFSAAPSPERIIGNGKVISVWPVRTGVLVVCGVAYFGAGVWPAEGLYLYAVDARSGALLWKNDTYGQGGMANISPQGHLAASAERLFMPAGRVLPAGFDKKTGRFLFQHGASWRQTGLFGGTHVQVAGDLVLTGVEQVVGMFEADGRLAMTEGLPAKTPSTGPRRVVAAETGFFMLDGKTLLGADARGWLAAHVNATQQPLVVASLGRQRNALDRERKQLIRQRQEAARKAGGKLPPESARSKQLAEQIARLDAEIRKARAARANWRAERDKHVRWRVPFEGSDELILAGRTLVAGGPGTVAAFDIADGRRTWSAKVDGRARSLAVAGGRLLVGTDTGHIYCFAAGEAADRQVTMPTSPDAFGRDDAGRVLAEKARRIVEDTHVRRGFALVLGEPTGRLAFELARQTELLVYVAVREEDAAAAARAALTRAGVCGGRVVVVHAPAGRLPFSDYFANLVVCGGRMFAADRPWRAEDVARTVKPCGGVLAMIYPTGFGPAAAERWGAWGRSLVGTLSVDVAALRKLPPGGFVAFDRGPLKGAGSWVHQYGEPGNTCASRDELVGGALGVLWYGEPGPGRMPNRHASAAAPLAFGGRLFIQGENVVMAYDAYNGVRLWQREIPGAMRLRLKTGASNFAGDGKSVFVAVGDECLRLDAATGRTLRRYKAPKDPQGNQRHWDYVAAADGVLFGSRANEAVFAMDIETGRLLWKHEGHNIEPRTLCIGGGRVYFVEKGGITDAQRAEALKGVKPAERTDRRGRAVRPDVRLVVALDARTGRPHWTRPQYVSDCVKVGSPGGDLTLMYSNNVLLLSAQPWNGHFWREFMAGEFSRRSLIALTAYSGELIWSGRKGYRSRPLIIGDRIIAEPWAWDLQTGRAVTRTSPLSGRATPWQMARPGHHCGNIAGAPHALFFRSGVLAYYDLDADEGTAHFAGQRPGCWVNCIPANGLVMMPEASSGCICPFALQTTIVFQPRAARRRTWGMYSTRETLTDAAHLAVNFGAPGDRKASDGTLWLAWPRPRSYERDYEQRLVMNFALGVAGRTTYVRRNENFVSLAGTKDPWIYAYAAEGLEKCSVPLRAEGAPPATYTVRLHFAELADAEEAVFDVVVQGRTVRKALRLAPPAGAEGRAVVEEVRGVRVTRALEVALRPVRGRPVLCGLEVRREPVGQ